MFTFGHVVRERIPEQVEKTVASTRVAIIGITESAQELVQVLEQSQRPKYDVVGFLNVAPANGAEDVNVLGHISDMFEIAREHNIDEYIVAAVPAWQKRMAEFVATNANSHPKICLVPSVYEAIICNPKIDRVNDFPLVTLNFGKSAVHRFIKRSLDVVFSTLALLACSPVMLLSAIFIKLTSRGSIMYKQERVGKDGRAFHIYKLRTMSIDAEKDGPRISEKSDSRVTFIGRLLRRTKIDEVPQFLNVLKGDMSVVGPRPERRCFVDKYSNEIPGYSARHQIRPGITGMAQVFGNYSTDPAVKLKYDLIYVYGGSIWTDIKIIALTPWTMIGG